MKRWSACCFHIFQLWLHLLLFHPLLCLFLLPDIGAENFDGIMYWRTARARQHCSLRILKSLNNPIQHLFHSTWRNCSLAGDQHVGLLTINYPSDSRQHGEVREHQGQSTNQPEREQARITARSFSPETCKYYRLASVLLMSGRLVDFYYKQIIVLTHNVWYFSLEFWVLIHSTEQRKNLEAKTCFKLIVVDLEASCLGPTKSGELRCKFERRILTYPTGFPGGSGVKNPPSMQEVRVWSHGREDSPGEGNGNLLHYSCLENSMDRRAWHITVPGVARESDMRATTGRNSLLDITCEHTHNQNERKRKK